MRKSKFMTSSEKKMQIQDFKIVYIGEKVSIPFYIANNSVGKI